MNECHYVKIHVIATLLRYLSESLNVFDNFNKKVEISSLTSLPIVHVHVVTNK